MLLHTTYVLQLSYHAVSHRCMSSWSSGHQAFHTRPNHVTTVVPAHSGLMRERARLACRFTLAVEGTNLQAVMATIGAQGIKTTSNDIMEVWKYLGVEAARSVIMSQIKEVMEAYGMTIDVRHTMLLADCMTSKVGMYSSAPPQPHPQALRRQALHPQALHL